MQQARQAVTINQTTAEGSKAIAQSMLDLIFPKAEQIIGEGMEHLPMLIIERNDGARAAFPLANLSKDQIAELHQRVGATPAVRCAALIMEAWQYKGDTRNEGERKILEAVKAGQLSVREIPGSTEVLLFNILVGDRQWLCSCEIERPANKLMRGELFDPNPGDGEHSAEGRFVRGDAARRAN